MCNVIFKLPKRKAFYLNRLQTSFINPRQYNCYFFISKINTTNRVIMKLLNIYTKIQIVQGKKKKMDSTLTTDVLVTC